MTQAPIAELGIVIVHYHAEGLLHQCVDALRRSTLKSFEALVVDNGSSGAGSLDWVESDPRFHLDRVGSNIGFAAGTNRGLERLPGGVPFVLLLNPDVMVEPTTLEEIRRVLLQDAALGAATCRVVLPSGLLDPACRRSEPTIWSALCKQVGLSVLAPRSRRFGAYNLAHLDDSQPHRIDAGTGAFLMVRRQALESCGGQLDERFFLYGEDLDLCRRLREAGHTLLYWPGVRAVHHKGSGRVRSPRVTLHFYRAMWHYYRKWGRFRSNPLVLFPLGFALVTLASVEVVGNEFKRHRARGALW